MCPHRCICSLFVGAVLVFFFNDTATTEIYTLSLHDALPISGVRRLRLGPGQRLRGRSRDRSDRKSTRLNSSHQLTSYAVFCLKKKKRTPSGPRIAAVKQKFARAGRKGRAG